MALLQPMRYVPRPTMEELYTLKNDYVGYHQRRIMVNREEEVFFKLQYQVPSPDGRSPLYSPAAYQIVEEMINHVAAENPTFNVLKRNEDEAEVKRSEKLTSWINGFWQSQDITLLLRKMLFHDCVRGCHVLRITYDPGQWPLEPVPPVMPEDKDILAMSDKDLEEYAAELVAYSEAKSAYKDRYADWKSYTEEHCPIMPQVIDPMFAFWEPTDDPKRIFLVWDRTVDEIIKDHPEMYDELGGVKPGTKLQYVSYFDEWDYAVWVESYGSRVNFRNQPEDRGLRGSFNTRPNTVSTIRTPTRHGYGFFPFVVDGPWITPLADPENQYPSMYYAIKSMLMYESTLLTQVAHMIRVNGWAPLIVKTDRAEGQKPTIDMSPGAINYIETEEDARYLEFSGQTMAVLSELIQAVGQYTSKGSGLGDILQGAPKGKSGYQQAQLAAMARVALVPIEHSTERTLRDASRYVFKLVRTQDEKITLLGQYGAAADEATLTPKDVQKIGRIEIKLRTVMPIDEGAKVANLTNMVKQGWISRETAARMVGIENPEAEHARWMAEEISNLPDVQKAMALQYVQEHWPDLYTILIGLEQQAQQKPPNTQAGPGGPGGAGGGAQLGAPGAKKQNAPNSAGEQNQVLRQAQTGGLPRKRLAEPADDGEG